MKLDNLPIGITDWSLVTPSVQQGGLGTATKRIRQFEDIKIRLIEFSANLVSNQWCHKGHIVFVVVGGVTIVHQNRHTCPLSPGGTYHVSHDVESPHRHTNFSDLFCGYRFLQEPDAGSTRTILGFQAHAKAQPVRWVGTEPDYSHEQRSDADGCDDGSVVIRERRERSSSVQAT
jgi:hypothetical protein